MKVVKVIIGVLAALFALAHALGLILVILKGGDSSSFAFSRYMGRIGGFAFGLAIAVACLKPKKSPKKDAKIDSLMNGDG